MDSRRLRSDTAHSESIYGRPSAHGGERGRSVYEPVEDDEDDPFTPPPAANYASRRDSQSTFFGRNDAVELQQQQPQMRPSGGRTSLYGQPRQEDVKTAAPWEDDSGGGFDIYADFNNAGPRYSGAPPLETLATGKDGYRNLHTPASSIMKGRGREEEEEPVELVTVPRFGAEWTKDELRNMTKRGRSEETTFKRKQAWREWNQDRRGLFGIDRLRRKTIVWALFIMIIVMIILLVICLPRAPSFGFNPAAPMVAGYGTPVFTRGPEANFTFNTDLDLEMNTSGNIIPLHINNIHASIYSKDTSKLLGEGDSGSMTRKAGVAQPLNISVTWQYSADNDSDTTWSLVHAACESASLYATGSRPGLNLYLILDMSIRGMLKHTHASTAITNVACPIQLSTAAS